MEEEVRSQYEAYPYPSRKPEEDGSRDTFGPLEDLEVMNHFACGGTRDWSTGFRVLVAGGGTGDASTGLAKQMHERGIQGEVVYLDLSTASRQVAESRAEALGLKNISFHTGSLLDVASLGLGHFDYINCSGVLHHLEEPEDGARALASVLAPGGVLGVMVYGEMGRTGVYHAQDLLRLLAGKEDLPAQVTMAKRVLPHLPHSNWLAKNDEMKWTTDLDDVEIVDRFLHTCDQAYRVDGCMELMGAAGLEIADFVPALLYRPEVFVSDPAVLARLAGMSRSEQWSVAELLAGVISKQSFFARRKEDGWVAPLELGDQDAVPELLPMESKALEEQVRKLGYLSLVLGAVSFQQPFQLNSITSTFLREMDGKKTLGELSTLAMGTECTRETYEMFLKEIRSLYNLLNGSSALVLHR